MEDLIANIAVVTQRGKRFTSSEEQDLVNIFTRLLEKIGKCENLYAAESYLDQLGQFQTELARACFKWKVPLPPKLRLLVREFDRSDDPELRATVFKRIREKSFCVTA